jgi:hypothetical protein
MLTHWLTLFVREHYVSIYASDEYKYKSSIHSLFMKL